MNFKSYFLLEHKSTLFKVSFVLTLSGLGLLVSCSNDRSNFALNGFKSVNFGMNLAQLRKIGFICNESLSICNKAASGGETLFGQAADVEAELVDNKVSKILLSVSMEPSKLVDEFNKSLGKSKTFEYVAATGQKMVENYWVSSESTSISVVTNLNKDEEDKSLYQLTGPRAHAMYNDKFATKESLSQIERISIKPKDY